MTRTFDFKSRITRRRFICETGMLVSAGALASPTVLRAQTDQTLRIRVASDPFPFDPVNGAAAEYEFVYRAIFAPMTRINSGGWSPYLAQEVVEDNDLTKSNPIYRIRINLPAGRLWSGPDQRALEPSDIRQSILRSRDAGASAWQDVKDVEIVASDKIYLILKRPNVTLWRETFPRAEGCVTFSGLATADKDASSLDTIGPYRIDGHIQEVGTILARSDDWRGANGVRRAALKVIPNYRTALTAFEAGEIDILDITEEMIGNLNQHRFQDFQDSFVYAKPTDRVYFLGMNTSAGETQNQRVRQAVEAAVDRSSVAQASLGREAAQIAYGILPRQFPGGLASRDPDLPTANKDRARALLKEANLPNGFDTTMSVPEAFGQAGQDMANAIKAQLADVGIRVRVVTAPADSQWWRRQVNQPQLFIDRTFQAYDPSTTLARFQSASPFNTPGFEDAEYDALFQEALFDSGAKRPELLSRMQRLIASKAAVVPIAQLNRHWRIRNKTVVPAFSPDGQLGDLIDFQVQR